MAANSLLRRGARGRILAGVAAVAALVWMVRPALLGEGDVVVVGGAATLDSLFSPLLVHLRENGRDATAVPHDDPCGAAAAIEDSSTGDSTGIAIVVSVPSACAGDPAALAVAALVDRGLTPVVLRLPGAPAAPAGIAVLDAEVVLGPEGTLARPCEWWDRTASVGAGSASPCRPDGTVLVRAADGSLTADGLQRVARMAAEAIG